MQLIHPGDANNWVDIRQKQIHLQKQISTKGFSNKSLPGIFPDRLFSVSLLSVRKRDRKNSWTIILYRQENTVLPPSGML